MNMEGDAGLRFYVFDDIADEKAFKTTYRSAMDTLPIDQAWPIASWRRPIAPST